MSTHNQGSFFGARTAVDKAGGAPRRRRWAPKVRTGCLTCKIRRVKCDEARPSCEKCLSTGRKCDGYEDEEKYHVPVDSTNARAYRSRSRSHQICNTDITNLHDASSTTFPSSPYCVSWIPFYGGELEKKNFDFFQSVTSSSLAGFHGSEFWARETLQVAHQYPALFHAITAFGSIHHCYLSDNTPCDVPRATTDNSRIEFGLREFNKAIKSMYKLIAQEDITFRDQQAILTTCILFTCLSTLQGRQLQAFMHVRNGIRLIHHWRLSHQHISEANRKIVNILLLTFIGLDTQIRPYISGQEALLHWGHEDIIVSSSSLSFDELQPFESLFEAYFELEVIFNRLLRLNFTEYLSDQWHLEIQLSVCQCDIWDARFSLLLSTMGYPTTASELGTLNFIRLRREYARFLMFPFTNPREESNVHDELSPLCLQILDLVQKVLENEPYSDTMTATSPNEREHHSKPHPIFVLGSTVLEILYVVATRSRDPSIRRQALHLMKLHPRREGICESMSGAKMVQWMIDIEEQGCPQFPLGGYYSSFAPSSPDEESCPLPSSSSSSNASIPATSSSCRGGCCGGNHASRNTSTVAVTSKIPCSDQGKWVCEIHRVVDTQYLLYTERQLKVVIWTLEDRILRRKGREMVVSWW